MRRERVSDDIYVFTSELYAQVTATAIVTGDGIVVVDTLPFPQETRALVQFLENLGRGPIRYLINTHWHGDHTNGNVFLLQNHAQLVSHELCAETMAEMGRAKMGEGPAARAAGDDDVPICVPDVTFQDGEMCLHLGGKSLQMIPSPGHTPDSIVVCVREDKVLVAADTLMPLPYFVGGNHQDFLRSLQNLLELSVDTVVQGHGEVLLRGEIKEVINSSIRYLNTIHRRVSSVVESGQSEDVLRKMDIESCGKSRIPLNGLVQDLHYANLRVLYEEMTSQND
jgi:glyoxylase-like metal-dependent hydrolase (beta-lactamase superfamily II)